MDNLSQSEFPNANKHLPFEVNINKKILYLVNLPEKFQQVKSVANKKRKKKKAEVKPLCVCEKINMMILRECLCMCKKVEKNSPERARPLSRQQCHMPLVR